jgi:Zn-dependent protease with chaperone function
MCLAATALSIAAGVLATQVIWACISPIGLSRSILRYPSLLFVIRTLPLSFPAGIVLFAVLPSFFLLEPRQTSERPDWWLAALAMCSLFAIGFFAVKLAQTLIRTRRTEREWMQSARRLDVPAEVPIYELQNPDSLVAVLGVFSPRIFVGERILAWLTPEELKAAVAHEVAHVRSLDNLKQALLSATGLSSLFRPIDRAFRSAAEISADSRAMRCRISPLDLGSAIVKVARLRAAVPSIAASHLVPDFEGSALQLRVHNLHTLFEGEQNHSRGEKYAWLVVPILLMIYVAKLPLWLGLAHKLTEMLVR